MTAGKVSKGVIKDIIIVVVGVLIIWFGLKKKTIAGGIILGSMLHLFTDWITARTVGIQWLYPLSMKNFHVYEIFPEKGQIPVVEMVTDPYWSFYIENKVLFGFEVGLNLIALFFIIKYFLLNQQKGTS
ncbi:MAG: metal-dependent hydrolase [Candidatus Marinimicrobia bacterium]|nr:metal-dependent hydrolase [Candidatus Neomarinimicrobiota bacterium]